MGDGDRYRLEPMRETRARDERVRTGELAAASHDARTTQAKVDTAAATVERARTALSAARDARIALVDRGTTAADIARAEHHVARRLRDLEAARDAHARALAEHRGQVAEVDAARTRLARARADREIIERHFERWRDARAKRLERRED